MVSAMLCFERQLKIVCLTVDHLEDDEIEMGDDEIDDEIEMGDDETEMDEVEMDLEEVDHEHRVLYVQKDVMIEML